MLSKYLKGAPSPLWRAIFMMQISGWDWHTFFTLSHWKRPPHRPGMFRYTSWLVHLPFQPKMEILYQTLLILPCVKDTPRDPLESNHSALPLWHVPTRKHKEFISAQDPFYGSSSCSSSYDPSLSRIIRSRTFQIKDSIASPLSLKDWQILMPRVNLHLAFLHPAPKTAPCTVLLAP